MTVRHWQSEAIPGLGNGDRELCSRPIIGPDPEFIQSPTVIAAKAFEEIVSEPSILPRPVGELMTGEVIQAVRDEYLLVNVKRRRNSLCKHGGDIVVGVTAVVALGAERALPFLRRDLVTRIGRVENESFELQFADATDLGSHFEC